MLLTSLCYLEQEGKLLLLHRVKKTADPNAGKWIGVGGKFEEGESPEECAVREVREETGLIMEAPQLRGIVTFVNDRFPTEYMFLFTCSRFSGSMIAPGDCPEGVLRWVDKEEALTLPMWEGDRVFFRLLAENRPFFSLKLLYKGDKLLSASLDGKELVI